MFEAVQFIEHREASEPVETIIGEYANEMDAVEDARSARLEYMETDSDDYAWWVVRKKGARLANFISDNKSDKEFVLDLTSGELVELQV